MLNQKEEDEIWCDPLEASETENEVETGRLEKAGADMLHAVASAAILARGG